MDTLDLFDKGVDRDQCLAAGNTATDEGKAVQVASIKTRFERAYGVSVGH
jgi:hypothetical protein